MSRDELEEQGKPPMSSSPPFPPPNWIDRAIRQAPWRTQTQASSLVLAVVLIVVVIGAVYLGQASRTAAAGRRLQELKAERELLEQQNAQLRAEIAALRSVPRLLHEAELRGYRFASPDRVYYLPVPQPPLAAPASPIPSSIDIRQTEAYTETLEGWLAGQFAGLRARFGPEQDTGETDGEAP